MEIFRVLTMFSDCGKVGRCDAIRYEGKIWLVPHWIEYPALGVKKPVRIVHLGANGIHQTGPTSYSTEAELLSLAVLEGRVPPSPPIEVVESPNIEIQIPTGSDRLH